jgi:hypothetical protein
MPSSSPAQYVASENELERKLRREIIQMKNIYRSFERLAVLAAISFVLLACVSSVVMAADSQPTMSKKELKTLLATAKTPADQQKLAAYYRDKAQRLTAKSQEFSAQADSMAALPAVFESKQGVGCQCPFHYRYFSKQYAQEAKDAAALAAQHEQLAQEYEAKAIQQK